MFAKRMAWSFLATLVFGLPAGAAEIRGILTRIDPDKKELVLEGRSRGARGLALSFQVEADTPVLFGQQRGQLRELAPGKRAQVFYEFREGRRVATLITVAGPRPTATLPSPDGNTLSGVLRRVSSTEREIIVVGPGRSAGAEMETTLLVPVEVQITKDQAGAKLEDLQEGDPVQVRTEKRDGKLVALSIQVGMPGPGRAVEPSRIERLREILKKVDLLLQLAEQRREGKP